MPADYDYDPRGRDESAFKKPSVMPWIVVSVVLGLVLVVGGAIFTSQMQDFVKNSQKNEFQELERKHRQEDFDRQMKERAQRPPPAFREFPRVQPPTPTPKSTPPQEKTIPESEWGFASRPKPTTAQRDMFDHVERTLAEKKQEKSDRVGGAIDDRPNGSDFVDFYEEPALLVGFEFTYGRYDDSQIINAIRPIYWTREKVVGGQWRGKPTGKQNRVEARPGFVVGGVTAYGGERLTGLKVSFRRILNGGLNADSRYESEEYGRTAGGRVVQLVSDGSPVVGIWGGLGETKPKPGVNELQSFGLVSVPANFGKPASKSTSTP